MKIPTGSDEEGGDFVNLTPLIDVVFNLLIFFMITSSFQEDERDLAVKLPEAENGATIQDLPETIFVSVRKDGSYTVGSEVLDKDELGDLLARAKRKNANQRVIVRGDREVPYEYPVGVLDICEGLEISTSLGLAPGKSD